MKTYKIGFVDTFPEEIQAEDLKQAEQQVLDLIDIQEE